MSQLPSDLSNLPENWACRPLKRLAEVTNSGIYGDEEPSISRPIPLRACTTAHIDPLTGFRFDALEYRYFSHSEVDRYRGRRGDIFVVKSSGSNTNVITGKRAQVNNEDDLVFTNFLMRVRANAECDSRFLYYLLGSSLVHERIKREVATTTYPNLNLTQYLSEPLPYPDRKTQGTIAHFLDHETDRIDKLIKKRERFLSLVNEKRTALNVLAVTGSILGNSSGGERGWFGVLPSGWKVRRAKFLFRERDTRSVTGEEELLTVSHITGVTSRAEKDVNMFLAESMEGYKFVFEGDVAVNTMWAWMGALGVSPLNGLISPSYGVYAPTGNHFTFRYLDLLLRSRPFVAEVNRRSKGVWSSRLRLYPDAFLDILFPVPEIDVQNEILAALDLATEREDKLAAASLKSLDRLREFRAALITAAVTGQIDVETWGKRGETDRRLDTIEAEMTESRADRQMEARA